MNNPLAGTDPSGYCMKTTGSNLCSKSPTVKTVGNIKSSDKISSVEVGKNSVTVNTSNGSTTYSNLSSKQTGAIVDKFAQQEVASGGTNQSGGDGVTTSDGVAATGIVAGIAEHLDTHPVWVGKNGQVKLNSPSYHGNQHNGSKAGQIAKAKEIAKKLGIPLAAASALLRGGQLPSELATMRANGASQQDITLQKVDAGVDISMAGIGVLGLPGFTAAVGYTIVDYSTGGNASKALVNGLQNIPVPSKPKVPDRPGGMKKFMHRLFSVPMFNIGQ
tara:strand:+ start:1885 stop:2709 length:825 start_codon:yes stop_codon:yes gene_type:complete